MAHQVQLQSFLHFEAMVQKPTWKDILLELIASKRFDPWNIDLVQLADEFLKTVKEMERMDFALQANVILAASILLKHKSDYLRSLSYQSDMSEFLAESDIADMENADEFPMLTLSSRIPPNRQVTLDELLDEMERIIKYDSVERVKVPRGSIMETIDLELAEHDIEREMTDVMARIRQNTDSEGWSLFSKLAKENDYQNIVYTLVCILHLVQREEVDIRQDTMFGEIFIKLLKEN